MVEQLQPRVVLPMHYFTRDVLEPVPGSGAAGNTSIDVREQSGAGRIARETLPAAPTIIALPGWVLNARMPTERFRRFPRRGQGAGKDRYDIACASADGLLRRIR